MRSAWRGWVVTAAVGMVVGCESGSSSGRTDTSAAGADATDGSSDGTDGTDEGDGSSDGADGTDSASDGASDGADGSAPTAPGVVGPEGMAAWDALTDAERDELRGFATLYLHQSVGQDLEDGAGANGFAFEYFGPGQTTVSMGLNGGIFTDVGGVPNGEPFQKMQVVRDVFEAVKDQVRLFSFSFGYADVRDEDREAVQDAYAELVADVKAAGVAFVHVTPPLVYGPDENPPKMAMRDWMIATFGQSDVIFDLQDIESLDGGVRCEVGGVWRICEANRSTEACPSKGQGIDGEGAGHICETKATEFAKALLYAYRQAAR